MSGTQQVRSGPLRDFLTDICQEANRPAKIKYGPHRREPLFAETARLIRRREYLLKKTCTSVAAHSQLLTAPDERRHLGGHDGHELYIGPQWQISHMHNRIRDLLNIHHGLGNNFAICLLYSLGQASRELR